MNSQLIFNLSTTEFRDLISEIFEEKFARLKQTSQEVKNEPTLISRLEVAKLFGVSKTTIDKWRRCKILPPIIKISARVFFDKVQIMELLQRKNKGLIETTHFV